MGSARLDITVPLRSFDLEVALAVGAETVALVGPSGAGKTTVLQAVAGLVRPSRGRISSNGSTWFDSRGKVNRRPEQRPVGYVLQEYALFPHLTVEKNVSFAGGERRDLLERLGIASAGEGEARRALRRGAAAGRDRAGTRTAPRDPAPRRADGRARPAHARPRPRRAARLAPGARAARDPRHARLRRRCRSRGPDRRPRRRTNRSDGDRRRADRGPVEPVRRRARRRQPAHRGRTPAGRRPDRGRAR